MLPASPKKQLTSIEPLKRLYVDQPLNANAESFPQEIKACGTLNGTQRWGSSAWESHARLLLFRLRLSAASVYLPRARSRPASSASGPSNWPWSAFSRSSPAYAGKPRRPLCLACRPSMRRRSWINFLQQCFEFCKAFAPEDAVVAHPVDQRLEAFRLGAVIDLPAFGALGDQAGLLQGLEVLRNGALRHAAPSRQFDDGDLVGADDPLKHGPPCGIGKRAHDGVDGSGFGHGKPIAYAN